MPISTRALRVPLTLLLALLVAGCAAAPAPSTAPVATAESATPAPTPAAVAESQEPDDDEAGGEPSQAATPTARPTETGPVTPPPTAAPTTTPEPQPFALDLYGEGDFVRQYTFDWCVGASVQMMLNMVREPNEASRERQGEIWDLARIRSKSRYGGANPVGWTAALNELGAGDYELVSVLGYEEALRTAAGALRTTGRPVGLVMWSGRHAWVMNGFTSIGDPGLHDEFEVTGIRVLDPLYPHGSRKWGASPKPNTLLTPTELTEQFVPRTGRRQPDYAIPGSYVLILPV